MDNNILETNCRMISDELSKEESSIDMELLCAKLLRINSLIGLSAECIKQAKQNLLYRQAQILKQHEGSKLPPSLLMKLIQSECWQEEAMLTWIDRLGAGLVHAGEHIRSVVSLRKAEMNNNL